MQVVDDGRRLTLLAGLLDAVPTAVAYVTGPEHVVEFANAACLRLLGGQEVVGRSARRAVPDGEGRGLVDKLDRVRRTGEPAEAPEARLEVPDADGTSEQRFLDVSFQPVRDGHGAVAGILLHAQDVTAHVRDRRHLQRLAGDLASAEERYRTLFETLPSGVVYHGADGAIIAANPAAARVLGVDADDLIGMRPQGPDWEAVREDGSRFPGDEHPAMVALRTGRVVPETLMGVRHATTGERRWLAVTAVPDVADESGRSRRAYAMFKDVTEARRAATALRDRDSFLGRLRDANVLGVVVGTDDRVVDANGAFLTMLGYDTDDLAAGGLDWRAMTPPEWAGSDDAALEQLRAAGACEPFEKEMWHRSGRRVPVLLGAAVVEQEPLTWVTFVTDLSARSRAEEERAKLVASAHAARVEARGAQEQLALLLGAGDLVAATHSREDLLDRVTRLVVPALADDAMVLLPTEAGDLRVTAMRGKDTAGTSLLSSLAEAPIPASGSVAFEAVHRTGRSRLVADLDQHRRDSPHLDPRLGEIADHLAINSVVAIPLPQGQRQRGVLALGRNAGRPPFTTSDLAVAEELGRRVAVGLSNVDTFAREHTVSEVLQRSVLPEALPAVPGVELAVVYLPATEGVDVGGDWYDAFPVGDGLVGLVIGDVVGHNLASASAMNQVRNALRALAVVDPAPATVLRHTNAALARLLPDALATVFYGVLDVARGRFAYANAGHPPPLLTTATGARFLTGAGELMLGVAEDARYRTRTQRLSPGTGLLLYSDGLVEDRTRSLDEGLDGLAGAFADGVPGSAADICARAQAALLRSQVRADDVCLLALRLAPVSGA